MDILYMKNFKHLHVVLLLMNRLTVVSFDKNVTPYTHIVNGCLFQEGKCLPPTPPT